jgi:hypothetical protein
LIWISVPHAANYSFTTKNKVKWKTKSESAFIVTRGFVSQTKPHLVSKIQENAQNRSFEVFEDEMKKDALTSSQEKYCQEFMDKFNEKEQKGRGHDHLYIKIYLLKMFIVVGRK